MGRAGCEIRAGHVNDLMQWWAERDKDSYREDSFSTAGIPPVTTYRIIHIPTRRVVTGENFWDAVRQIRDRENQ